MRVVRNSKYKLIWNIAHGLPYPFDYSVNNNQLTFTDTAGPLASKDAATYQYRLDQDRLIFDVVNDTSSGRTKVITGDLWTLTK